MNILIIGINGFIGSKVAESFLNKKYSVLGTINNPQNIWRIKDFIHKIETINCKINNIKDYINQIKDFRPDVVFYCGWYGSSSQLLLTDEKQFTENIPGLLDLIQIAKDCNVKHFVGVGAGWEYGNFDIKPKEDQTPKPINAYGSAKYIAYQICNELLKIHDIKFTWVRPFWLYGDKDFEKRLIPQVINKCLKNEEIELNPCEHFTSYLFIDDFVDGINLLIEKQHEGIYNFSGSYPQRVKDIVEQIAKVVDFKLNIKYNKPYPKDFVFNLEGENDKLQRIGWKQKTDISQGLEKTIEFYKKLQ